MAFHLGTTRYSNLDSPSALRAARRASVSVFTVFNGPRLADEDAAEFTEVPSIKSLSRIVGNDVAF